MNLRLVVAAGALTFLAACSPAQPDKCGPSNCAGCCDLSGVCQQPSSATCGQGGNLCSQCFGNQLCSFGICVSTGNGGGSGSTGGGGGNTGGGGGATGGGGGVTGGGGGTTGGGGGTTGGGGGVTGGGGGTTGGGGGVTGGGGGASTCSQTCTGCCQGNTCVTAVSTAACGQSGAACQICDTGRADNCDLGGCSCGSSGLCAVGQRCVGSQCVCDSGSCASGCCQGNFCVTALTTSACGLTGSQCMSCDTTKANNCGNGTCRCGTNAACGTGQRCFNSQCVCDSSSCVNGCCSGSACLSTVTQCGTNGGACAPCDSARADNCGPGGCRCGAGPQCALGVQCVGGSCGGVRSWTLRATTGAPTPRQGHAMAFHQGQQRTILFGGESGSTPLSDTWSYNGATGTWTQLTITGPTARSYPAMAYDPVRNQVVLFGGEASGSVKLADTWVFNGTTWSNVTPSSGNPPARFFHSLVWDSTRQRVVLYGGEAAAGSDLGDTWEWNGTAWTQRTGVGTAPVRAVHNAAYDQQRQRLVFYGGFNNGAQPGTWELSTSWAQVTTATVPGARQGAAMTYDPNAQWVMMVGGYLTTTIATDSWVYDGVNWAAVTPNTGARAFSAMVFDSVRGRVVLFGGNDGVSAVDDTWEF